MNEPITLKDVSKRYDGHAVLRGFTHTFEPGTVTCIMGPSGCGKTTLLRIILGLEAADGGEVNVPDAPIACVFQEDRLIRHLSALRNVKLVLLRCATDERARELLTQAGLSESLNKRARLLSGGMARRVSIVRALAYDAPCVIMDEPLKGLDAGTRELMIELIRRHMSGKTFIIVTHDLSDAHAFGGSVLEMGFADKDT